MAASPYITFKAGCCNREGRKVIPDATPGYIYLYIEDELLHFCWRPRSAPSNDPTLDLIMFPGDGNFTPLVKEQGSDDIQSPTNGRIYVLGFSSSSQKHYFWMQSKTQHREGKLNWFSQRDQRLGQIVHLLLQGEDVNVEEELEDVRRDEDDNGPSGDGDAMDVDQADASNQDGNLGGGGAGADATGGDPRHEGASSREGGANGGRAAPNDTSAIVQNFLNSLNGGSSSSAPPPALGQPYATLPDLLHSATTVPFIETASIKQIDHLCSFLPPDLFLLAQASDTDSSSSDPAPSPAVAQAAIEALSIEQKKDILKRVLRSPQMQQSLGSLTIALRDGGLPMIGEALQLKVENKGLVRGGTVPLGGGAAVEAFVDGVKKTVDEEEEEEKSR